MKPAPRLLGAAAIVALAWLSYAGSLHHGFTYDDAMVLEDAAPLLRSGPLVTLVSPDYFARSREGTYRPVVTASYMLDARLFGASLPASHAQGIVWHALCALGVAALAARLLAGRWRYAPLVAGLLFACHPLTTEAVENVSFREDLLATAFVLAALLLALRNTWPALVGAALCWALALFSKESAVVFPLLLWGTRLALPGAPPRERQRPVLLREASALLLVGASWAAIRFGPMAGPPNYAAFAGGTRADTLWTMPRVLAHYLRLIVAPWPLVADYSGAFEFGPPSGDRLAALLLVPALPVALWWLWRRDRVAAWGLGWFLCALAPVSNVMATPIFAAERFLYLPLVGPMFSVGALAALAASRLQGRARAAGLAVGLGVLATFVTLTNLRHPAWASNLALWADVVNHNPRSYRAHANLAIELRKTAPDVAGQLFEASLRLCPYVEGRDDVDNVLGSSNAYQLGLLRLGQGRLDEARAAFVLSLKIRPRNPDPRHMLEQLSHGP
jgi:hypothetical protein